MARMIAEYMHGVYPKLVDRKFDQLETEHMDFFLDCRALGNRLNSKIGLVRSYTI